MPPASASSRCRRATTPSFDPDLFHGFYKRISRKSKDVSGKYCVKVCGDAVTETSGRSPSDGIAVSLWNQVEFLSRQMIPVQPAVTATKLFRCVIRQLVS